MTLVNLKNEVEAAKELLAQAEENYKKGILEAAQNGELAERKTAMWKEVYSAADCKTRFFCDGCGYYAPLQSDFCPKCGAKMANAQHYAPKQAAAWLDNAEEIKNCAVLKISEAEWAKMDDPQKRTATMEVCDEIKKISDTKNLGNLYTGLKNGRTTRYRTYCTLYDEIARLSNER